MAGNSCVQRASARASARAFVRAFVRAYVRLSAFNEFLLPSCTKAVQCLESDNGSNSRVAAFSKHTGNVFLSHRYVRVTGTRVLLAILTRGI